ncbi:TM2 domain-containing protein [Thiohalorhabdus methylotrophus]|uniref:TM2 domain-containing protein n=1 Tax=Thiohalorhabdus methylotrophus TaxID=3242694 RepID=A0ABV4TR96_9GAMM
MGKQWEAMDLKGGGLQQVQMAYKSVARTRLGAYLRWLLFPLGLHRFYLLERRGGLAYPAASLIALGVQLAFGLPWLWLVPGLAALADLFWIPGRLVRINKELRLQTMMSGAQRGAPRGFKGHYTEENATGEQEDRER